MKEKLYEHFSCGHWKFSALDKVTFITYSDYVSCFLAYNINFCLFFFIIVSWFTVCFVFWWPSYFLITTLITKLQNCKTEFHIFERKKKRWRENSDLYKNNNMVQIYPHYCKRSDSCFDYQPVVNNNLITIFFSNFSKGIRWIPVPVITTISY